MRTDFSFDTPTVQQYLLSEIMLCVVCICDYLFGCRLEFVVHVVLREIFGGEMEKLTGGWREL